MAQARKLLPDRTPRTVGKYWRALELLRSPEWRRRVDGELAPGTGIADAAGIPLSYGVTNQLLRRVAGWVGAWEGAVRTGPGVLPPAHAAQLCDGAQRLAARLPRLETPLEAALCYGAQRGAGTPLDPEEFLAGAGFPLTELERAVSTKRLRAHLPDHRLWTLWAAGQGARRAFLLCVRDAWEEQCALAAAYTGLALRRPQVGNSPPDARPHLSAAGLAPGFVATLLAAGLGPSVELLEGTASWREVGYLLGEPADGGRSANDPPAAATAPGGPLAAAFAVRPEVGGDSARPGEVWAVPTDRWPATPATAAQNTERLRNAYATGGVLIGRRDVPGGQERLRRAHEDLIGAFGRSPRALELARVYGEGTQAIEALRQALRALAPGEFEPGPCDLCPPP